MPVTLGDLARIAEAREQSSLTRTDLDALGGLADWPTDPRRISVGRLFYVDLPAAIRRYVKGYTKDERETLRTDALGALVAREEWRGMPLGGVKELPYRRDWLEPTGHLGLSIGAWRAMHAALRHATKTQSAYAERKASETETPTDPIGDAPGTLGELAERRDYAGAWASRSALVMEASLEEFTATLGVSKNGARALQRAAHNLSDAACAHQWGLSVASVPVVLSHGRKELDSKFPTPFDLIDSLRAAQVALEAIREDGARESILEWVRNPSERAEHEATGAARIYLSYRWSGKDGMPDAGRAMRSALVKLLSRYESDPDTVATRARVIAESIGRVLTAEEARAKARKGTGGTHLGGKVSASGTGHPLAGPTFKSTGEHPDAEWLAAWENVSDARIAHAIRRARRAYYNAHPDDWSAARAPYRAPDGLRFMQGHPDNPHAPRAEGAAAKAGFSTTRPKADGQAPKRSAEAIAAREAWEARGGKPAPEAIAARAAWEARRVALSR